MPGTGDDLKKVRTGDPLHVPAGAYNLGMEALAKYQAAKGPRTVHVKPPPPPNSSVILIKNGSGASVEKYGVLATGTPTFNATGAADLFLSDLLLGGTTPSSN